MILMVCTLLFSLHLMKVAADEFFLSVDIPASDGATYDVFKITNGIWPTNPTGDLNLTFTVDLKTVTTDGKKAFLANEYYAINVAPNGSGLINLKLNYEDKKWPTNQTVVDKLGTKGTATVAAVNPNNVNDETVLLTKSLIGSDNQTVLASDVPSGKYMRVYVALANGTEATSVGVTPFTPADEPGLYEGTLTLTALPL